MQSSFVRERASASGGHVKMGLILKMKGIKALRLDGNGIHEIGFNLNL
jgi:hypothetical protein